MESHSAQAEKKISDIMSGMFQAGFDDWREMLGFEASVRGAEARVLPCSATLFRKIVGADVLVRTLIEGRSESAMIMTFAPQFVGAAVAKALMIPESEESVLEVEDEEHVGAVQELMNLFCGSLTRSLTSNWNRRLRISQSLDHLAVEFAPESVQGFREGTPLCCIRLDVETGGRHSRAWCMISGSIGREFL